MTAPKTQIQREHVEINGVPVRLYSVQEAAGVLGASPTHVYRLIADGALPTFGKLGRGKAKTRIRSDHLAEFIESGTQESPARGRKKTA